MRLSVGVMTIIVIISAACIARGMIVTPVDTQCSACVAAWRYRRVWTGGCGCGRDDSNAAAVAAAAAAAAASQRPSQCRWLRRRAGAAAART